VTEAKFSNLQSEHRMWKCSLMCLKQLVLMRTANWFICIVKCYYERECRVSFSLQQLLISEADW